MKIFSTNTCPVPNDLESVIHHKDEVPAELGGMSEQQVQKSGKVLSHSTKPETIRLLLFAYVDRENFIKSEALAMLKETRRLVCKRMHSSQRRILPFVYFQHPK